MMHIAVAGWFGGDNFGDELLLDSAMTLLRRPWPDAEFTVIGADPRRVSAVHGTASVRLPSGKASIRRSAHRRLATQLADFDLLVLGPGTVFQERSPTLRWPGTYPVFVALVRAARRARVPIIVLGAGVREGGTWIGRLALRGIARHCVAIATRDVQSARQFGPSADAVGDLAAAWTLLEDHSWTGCNSNRCGVSGRPLAANNRAYSGLLERGIVALRTANLEPTFFTFSLGAAGAVGEDDRDCLASLTGLDRDAARLPPLDEFADRSAVGEWLTEFADQRLVLATRLHAVIIALALGVPTVAIAYEEKVHAFMQDHELSHVLVPVVDGHVELAIGRALSDAGPFEQARRMVADEGARLKLWVDALKDVV